MSGTTDTPIHRKNDPARYFSNAALRFEFHNLRIKALQQRKKNLIKYVSTTSHQTNRIPLIIFFLLDLLAQSFQTQFARSLSNLGPGRGGRVQIWQKHCPDTFCSNNRENNATGRVDKKKMCQGSQHTLGKRAMLALRTTYCRNLWQQRCGGGSSSAFFFLSNYHTACNHNLTNTSDILHSINVHMQKYKTTREINFVPIYFSCAWQKNAVQTNGAVNSAV